MHLCLEASIDNKGFPHIVEMFVTSQLVDPDRRVLVRYSNSAVMQAYCGFLLFFLGIMVHPLSTVISSENDL